MKKIKLCLITFGIIIGIVGILHGSAELLKGSAFVESHSVSALPENWPNTNFNTMTRGSPVFSLLTGIPFYVLGLLAITVSVAFIVFSATLIRTQKLGVGLLLFTLCSVGIFLFGAGRGTPIAISLPLIVTGILLLIFTNKKERSERSKKTILSVFYFFYAMQISSWILFFPGLFVLSFYTEIPQALFFLAFMSMPVANLGVSITGFMYDRTIHNYV